jgi:FG-GAP-like repeat
VVADPSNNSADILLGNGNGSFAPTTSAATASTPYGQNATVVADFNGDGKLDLAVAETNFPHGSVSVQLGNGNGTFGKPLVSPLIESAINNNDLMRGGDFNGDRTVDLLIEDDYSKGFTVLLGKGDGTFENGINTPVNYAILSLATGDFNGDGKTDVVVTNNSGSPNGAMVLYLGNGDGTFRSGAQYAVPLYAGWSNWRLALPSSRRANSRPPLQPLVQPLHPRKANRKPSRRLPWQNEWTPATPFCASAASATSIFTAVTRKAKPPRSA